MKTQTIEENRGESITLTQEKPENCKMKHYTKRKKEKEKRKSHAQAHKKKQLNR